MDPFALAADALFASPLATDATYIARSQPEPVTIRVIRTRGDRTTGFGSGQVLQRTNTVDIRRSEIAEPESGDGLLIGDEPFELFGDPELDEEGVTWTCGLREA